MKVAPINATPVFGLDKSLKNKRLLRKLEQFQRTLDPTILAEIPNKFIKRIRPQVGAPLMRNRRNLINTLRSLNFNNIQLEPKPRKWYQLKLYSH